MNKHLTNKKESQWSIAELPKNGKLFYRTIDNKIMNEMPTKTETFLEQSAIKSVYNRMLHFVKSGK